MIDLTAQSLRISERFDLSMAFFKKKTAEQPQEAMSLEDVMKKFDLESNTRIWEGTPKLIVACVLAIFSLFCIYVTFFGNICIYAGGSRFFYFDQYA